MQLNKWLFCLFILNAATLMVWLVYRCKEEPVIPGIHEASYTVPFSLTQGGESIDVLVRVRESQYAHGFNLVFSEQKSMSQRTKDRFARIYWGEVAGDDSMTPYPISVRIRIDAVDEKNAVHIDQLISDRHPFHSVTAENGDATWRAQSLYFGGLAPGVYRVRVENLVPVPDIDFPTLFQFERVYRK